MVGNPCGSIQKVSRETKLQLGEQQIGAPYFGVFYIPYKYYFKCRSVLLRRMPIIHCHFYNILSKGLI